MVARVVPEPSDLQPIRLDMVDGFARRPASDCSCLQTSNKSNRHAAGSRVIVRLARVLDTAGVWT